MSDFSELARARRDPLIKEARAILDKAASDKRDLSRSENKRMEALHDEIERYTSEADRIEKADGYAAEAAEIRGGKPRVEGPANTMSTYRDTTDYGNDATEIRDLISEYRATGYAARDLPMTTRALQSAGGTAIPVTFVEQVTVAARDGAPLLDPQVVSMHGVGSGEQWTFPVMTDPATGGTVTAEAASLAELDATLTAIDIKPFKYGFIQNYSNELDTDNVIALQSTLAAAAGAVIGQDANAHLTSGTGTVQPFGFTVDATSAGTAQGTAQGQATDNFFSYYDLVDAFMSLKPQTRQRASWMVSTDAYTRILKARDSNGEPIVEMFPTNSPTVSLMGAPLIENPDMVAAASATTSTIAVGDFKAFHVAMLPLRVELSRDYLWSTDSTSLRVVSRLDGRLIDTSAVKVLTLADA